VGPTVGLFGFLAQTNTMSAKLHACMALDISNIRPLGVQAALDISNIRPLKVNVILL